MRLTTIFAVFGLLFAASSAHAGSMSFQVLKVNCPKNCTKVLFGEGEIKYDTDRKFRSALRKVGRNAPVILHSPGGDLAGGLKLGLAFREMGSSVGVAPGGACFSACAYALFGGVNRKVLTGGQLGVHEFIEVGRDPKKKLSAAEIKHNKEIVELLNVYAEAMGVSPDVIGMAVATSHNDIKVLSKRQLKRLRVTTGS
jgi:hypothetical protein